MKTLTVAACLIISALASATENRGIFSHESCRLKLERILEESGRTYISDAWQKGLRNFLEISEYIERRKRAQFLLDQYDAARLEEKLAQQIFRPNNFQAIGQVIKIFANMWFSGEILGKEFAPLIVEIYEARPPHASPQREAVLDILGLRTGMAMNRAFLSEAFVQLPLTSAVSHLSPNHLSVANRKAQNKILEALKSPTPRDILKYTLLDALRTEIASDWETDREPRPKAPASGVPSISQKLLASSRVPQSLKDEISMEVDFEKKYHLPPHPFFKKFLEKVAAYFSIPPI